MQKLDKFNNRVRYVCREGRGQRGVRIRGRERRGVRIHGRGQLGARKRGREQRASDHPLA